MIRLFSIALTVLVATYAVANERPALVPYVAVGGEVVTLGDLIERAGPAASTPLFRAPELGGYGTIQAWRIVDAARAYGIVNIDLRGTAEVRVERQARVVSEVELVDAIAAEMLKRIGSDDRSRVSITIDGMFSSFHLDAGTSAPLLLERFAQDAATGRFEAVLVAIDPSGRRSRPLRINGTGVEQVDIVRLRRTVARGEVVNAADITIDRMPRTRLANDAVIARADVVGFAARRSLSEGTILRAGDVEKPRVVQRNDPVTIVFEAPSLLVTARGRAMDGGAVGDIIDVQNISSRRTVQGVIAGPGRVIIRVGGHRRVAAAAPPPPTASAPRP